MPIETERRWIVHQLEGFNRDNKVVPKVIEQAYPNPYRDPCVRVRITDGEKSELTSKSGSGLVREERPTPIGLLAARVLYDATPYRLKKLRFVIDGWEVDCYQDNLRGLVVLEREFASNEVMATLPPWVTDAYEVTETLDNRQLAILAAHGFDAATIREDRVPKKIVLTGGPTAGKSSMLTAITGALNRHVHVIPEVATINFSHLQVGIPTDHDHARRYNVHAVEMQRIFEDLGRLHAHQTGRQAVVMDRGVLDNEAYCPDVLQLIGSSREREYSEYLAVIHLAVSPEGIYDQLRGNNPARPASETYAVAMRLEESIRQSWGRHPNYHFVDNRGDWVTKEQRVLSLIFDDILRLPRDY